jgi:predicted permease
MLQSLGASLPRRDVSLGAGVPRLDEIGLDTSELAFTLAASLLAAFAFGLVPALRQSGADRSTLGGSDTPLVAMSAFRRDRLQSVLVIAQVAATMMLLIGGGLLIRSFINVLNVDLGYDARNVMTFRVRLPRRQYPVTLPDEIVRRVRLLPAVNAAGYTGVLPMTYQVATVLLGTSPPPPNRIPAPPPPPTVTRRPEFPDLRIVSHDYLNAMGINIVAGRGFATADDAGQPQVMVINQTLARSGWLGEQAIGQHIYAIGSQPWEIVGIVEDSRQFSNMPPVPQVFIHAPQAPRPVGSALAAGPLPYFVVRVDGTSESIASAISRAIRQLDAQAIVDDVATMEQLVSNSVQRERLYTWVLGILALVAATIAMIGVYGVMTYAVARRTKEIGIRVALGARSSEVRRLVLGRALMLAAVGVVLGVGGALALSRHLEAMLFGVTRLDPLTFVAVSVLFFAAATFAAYVPARRATKVDPLVALRCE